MSRTHSITHHVPEYLLEAFMENAHTFLRNACGGDTPAQRSLELRAQDRDAGLDSLAILLDMTWAKSAQYGIIARFLASLYNGSDFPFDTTELRGLDADLFEHCLAVLRLDNTPTVEIHKYIPNGNTVFRKMLMDWDLIKRPTPPPVGDCFHAVLSSIDNAPGYRDACMKIRFEGQLADVPCTEITFSAADTARIACDLLEIHQSAWSPVSGRAAPLDVKEGERKPMWLR